MPLADIYRNSLQRGRDLAASTRNARRAFHPREFDYTLGLAQFAGRTVAYRAGTSDEAVLADSFDNDIFLEAVPGYSPSRADTVIDVGAHIGTFTLLIAPRVARVIAVEASLETYRYLRLNCLANRLDNVTAIHAALTDADGEVELGHDRGNWGHSIMLDGVSAHERVTAVSLETLLSDNGIDACVLLRSNCEGAEFPMLLAAPPDVLRRFSWLLVLYHLDLAREYKLADLVGRLEENGFRVELRNQSRTGERGWMIAKR